MTKICNTTVCVVGGAGFLGSHVVHHLVQDRNCRVLVVDDLCVGRREFINSKATFVHHDITGSEDHLYHLLRGRNDAYRTDEVEPEWKYVLNYASYPYVPDCYTRPLRVFDVNAAAAIKVINAAAAAGCRGILQVSSAEVYGGYGLIGGTGLATLGCQITEHTKVQPVSTYAVAKAAVDAYCQVAWRERGTPVLALRQFNCIGERETHPYVVPEIISQLSAYGTRPRYDSVQSVNEYKDRVTVHLGNNSQRDFMYAGDAVRLAVQLLEQGLFGEVYNLGSEQSISIYDLAKLIGKEMGYQSVAVVPDDNRRRKWEAWYLRSDNTKLYNLFDADELVSIKSLLVSLPEAIRRTVAWYRSNNCRWPWVQ